MGRLRDGAMAAEQARRLLRRPALGARADAAAAGRARQSRAPAAGKMPDLGNNWGPRVSLAIGRTEPLAGAAPGLRDVLRPHRKRHHRDRAHPDRLTQRRPQLFHSTYGWHSSIAGTSAAPPFPYVLSGLPSSIVKPGAVEFAPNFRNPEVHQAVAAIEQPLPGRMELTASMMLSLGRRLPVFIDSNLAPPLTNSQQPQSIRTTFAMRLPPRPRVPATPMACAATSAWVPSRPHRSRFLSMPLPQARSCRLASIRTTSRSTSWRAKQTRPMKRPWSSSRATAVAA